MCGEREEELPEETTEDKEGRGERPEREGVGELAREEEGEEEGGWEGYGRGCAAWARGASGPSWLICTGRWFRY